MQWWTKVAIVICLCLKWRFFSAQLVSRTLYDNFYKSACFSWAVFNRLQQEHHDDDNNDYKSRPRCLLPSPSSHWDSRRNKLSLTSMSSSQCGRKQQQQQLRYEPFLKNGLSALLLNNETLRISRNQTELNKTMTTEDKRDDVVRKKKEVTLVSEQRENSFFFRSGPFVWSLPVVTVFGSFHL